VSDWAANQLQADLNRPERRHFLSSPEVKGFDQGKPLDIQRLPNNQTPVGKVERRLLSLQVRPGFSTRERRRTVNQQRGSQ